MKHTLHYTFVCPICGTNMETYFEKVLIIEGEPARKRVQPPIQRVVPKHYCPLCGFRWRFTDGDLDECVKEYIKNHPVKSCLGAI